MSKGELLVEILSRIEDRLDRLEKEINKLKNKENVSLSSTKKAVFHSLSKAIDEHKARKETKRESLEPALKKAAEAAIKHYKLVPPSRGGIS